MRAAALWRAAGLVVLLAAAAVIPLAKNVTVTHVGVFVLLYVGAAVAWNIFSGFTGYISLGAAVFFGTGVYTVVTLLWRDGRVTFMNRCHSCKPRLPNSPRPWK